MKIIKVFFLIVILMLAMACKKGDTTVGEPVVENEENIEIDELPEIVFFEFNFEKYNVHGHYMTNQGEVYYFKIIPYENFSFEWHESDLGYSSQRPAPDTLSELLDFFKSADKTTLKKKADVEELNENYRKLLKVKTSDENYEDWENNYELKMGVSIIYGVIMVNGEEQPVYLLKFSAYEEETTIDPNGEEILSWLSDKLPFSEPYYEQG